MSAAIKKRFGATLNLYIDGQGYDSDITISCDNSTATQFKCPFALGEIMPMAEGSVCSFCDGSVCHKLAAHLEVLKKGQALIKKRIAEIEDQMEDAF